MTKPDKQLESQLQSLGILADPVRRAVYFHVLGQDEEVSRDQAARALHMSRGLAAFHLDKLVESRLLEASYRRLSGRTGPGAGRPSKLYRRSSAQIDVTLPARRYEVAARLLAGAMNEAGPDATAALERAAEDWGREMGRRARERAGHGDRARLLRNALSELQGAGFEPRKDSGGEITLRNCPFDALKSEARSLICGMNLALCRGLVAGLGSSGLTARFEPRPGRCCVILGPDRAA